MNPFFYLKALVGAAGANFFPPICDWVVTFIPGNPPPSTQFALSALLVSILTGGSIYATTNTPITSAALAESPPAD
jgi:hypothetical protein